jgi:hypothetical protein
MFPAVAGTVVWKSSTTGPAGSFAASFAVNAAISADWMPAP